MIARPAKLGTVVVPGPLQMRKVKSTASPRTRESDAYEFSPWKEVRTGFYGTKSMGVNENETNGNGPGPIVIIVIMLRR
jgi:hypothetical protein